MNNLYILRHKVTQLYCRDIIFNYSNNIHDAKIYKSIDMINNTFKRNLNYRKMAGDYTFFKYKISDQDLNDFLDNVEILQLVPTQSYLSDSSEFKRIIIKARMDI